MPPHDPSISTQAGAPRPVAGLAAHPTPPRRVVSYRDALLLTSTLWSTGRARPAEADRRPAPATPVRLTAADLLRRACALGDTGAALRPIIRMRRQDPIHREDGAPPAPPPAAAPTTPSPAPAPKPLLTPRPPAHPRAQTPPPQPSANPAQPAQNPIHREDPPQAAIPAPHPPAADQAQPVRPPATPTRIPGQDPMHRDTARAAGPLRNGNPRGNPNAAPRCGATNRAGCPCRAPAMRGKLRCRMHGGASTGPRTADGLDRLRAARTTHGRYAAPQRTRARYVLTADRRARARQAALREETHLIPLARARLHANPPELDPPPPPPLGQVLSRAQHSAIVQREARALAPWKLAVLIARAQRHGANLPSSALLPMQIVFAALPPAPACPAVPASAPGPLAP